MDAGPATFGRLPDGRQVERVLLAGGGLTASVLTYGARVQDLRLQGIDHPIVLGAPDLPPYLDGMRYFGAIVGRFANRIAGGAFAIDGRSFAADRNFLGRHCLHGGAAGAGQQLWQLAELAKDRATLRLELADGHMGFPGAMQVEARYRLPGGGVLEVEIRARSDAPTPCSFAHHGLFNLDGAPDIAAHELQVDAEAYLPVDAELIPTGEIAPVAGTPFDFRRPRPIGTHGYDHNLCLAHAGSIRPVARLRSLSSGVSLAIETDAEGLQVYDGGQISGLIGLGGRAYDRRAGIALETQCWPDAPNRPAFPPSILRPGQLYRHRARYVFGRD